MSTPMPATNLNSIVPKAETTMVLAESPADINERPYDPTQDRESVRGTIAQALVWTLVAVIACVMLTGLITIYACNGKDACVAETIEMKTIRIVIELVFTPSLGLVGAVTGFYFGEKSGAAKAGS